MIPETFENRVSSLMSQELMSSFEVLRPIFWGEKYDELVAWLISQGTNSSNRPHSVLNDYNAHIVMNGVCNILLHKWSCFILLLWN